MEMREFDTPTKNTWCPGCNNFGILTAVKQALAELVNSGEMKPEEIVILSGVGCHGKISDYIKVNSFYCLHGRTIPPAMGIRVANQKLKVIAFSGDGDAYAEGISHVIHAARRNLDITLVVHDNEVFALTTSQVTPTTKKGFKTKSAPKGSFETPLNPLHLMLSCGATFVARGFSGDIKHLKSILIEAVRHRGFSFIDVIQECVTFNPIKEKYLPKIYDLNKEGHKVTDFSAAWKRASEIERIPIGIFYREERETYEKQLLNERILVEEGPVPSIKKVLQEFT
ncbi:MAG: thiamine pyrophosphate-dependent enzyme [Candidatus Hadarchaeum sp.]|uniref:thiamine pyrophosphate-dependent enzyme n=1 Tax=Candidatus Hadarchaeum sp. TaxID=2883567 RepID=UPI003D1443D6